MAMTQEVRSLALTLMEGLACPRSVTVAILIRYGEWRQIADLKIHPRDFVDAEDYWAASVATAFLRKCPFLETGIDTEAVAIEKWYAAERQNYLTNHRLSVLLDSGPFGGQEDQRILDAVNAIRKELVNLIGNEPPSNLQGKFGPGATLSDKSTHTTVGDKMSSVPTLTHDAWPHLVPWTGTQWAKSYYAWSSFERGPVFVRGNHFFVVPKDATTDRACAKEPSINGYYQSACGLAMRRRMRFAGIDIKNGKSIHMRVACLGSLTGELCTIDLSSASDTISRVLVELLLPPKWYALLASLRSTHTLMPGKTSQGDGKWVKLEKFSSMGNGFTFELETAIFCSIARSVQKTVADYDSVKVFGDDIIVPKSSFVDVIALLRYFGLTPNEKKTFSDGEFRESCGGDYFRGVAVRPYHMEGFSRVGSSKKGPPCEPHHYISIANGIRRLADQEPSSTDRWARLRRSWFSCLDNVPSDIRRLRGPEGLGDTVIHDSEERWITRSRATNPCVRYVRVYRPVARKRVRFEGFAYETQFAVALYLAGSGEKSRTPEGDLIPRDAVTGYKMGWVAFS